MKQLFFFLILLFSVNALSAQELPPVTEPADEQSYSTAGLQVQPEFPGGVKEFQNYVLKSIKKKKISATGKIYITFVVEKDGMISDVKVVKGGDEGINKKLTKILHKSPKWTPGRQNDKPVRTRYTLPLTFN